MRQLAFASVQNNGVTALVVSGINSRIAGITIEDVTLPIIIQDSYNAHYNNFVNNYNHEFNRIDENCLCTLPCWTVPSCGKLVSWCSFCFIILFSLLPYTSYFTFILFFIMLVRQIITVHNVRQNIKLVPNPFARMIYAPDIYSYYSGAYLKFTAYHELTSFIGVAASSEETSLLLGMVERRIAQGESVTILFYKDAFRDDYTKVLTGICCRMTCTIILVLISFVGVLISSALNAGLLIVYVG
jgi:hypothetical protein